MAWLFWLSLGFLAPTLDSGRRRRTCSTSSRLTSNEGVSAGLTAGGDVKAYTSPLLTDTSTCRMGGGGRGLRQGAAVQHSSIRAAVQTGSGKTCGTGWPSPFINTSKATRMVEQPQRGSLVLWVV